MQKSLSTIQDTDFEIVRQYLHTGKSTALTAGQQQILDRCLLAYQLLKKYPQRGICINQFIETEHVSFQTAARYVDFARQNWGDYIDMRRDFIEAFFLDKLIDQINSDAVDAPVRAKLLATLQKHLEHMPEQRIDPRLMEQNTVNIQINIAGRNITLSEEVLDKLPVQVRETLLSSLYNDIDDQEAIEILDS